MIKDKDYVLMTHEEFENVMAVVRAAFWFCESSGTTPVFVEAVGGEEECSEMIVAVENLLPQVKKEIHPEF